jgi:hypothetical protein
MYREPGYSDSLKSERCFQAPEGMERHARPVSAVHPEPEWKRGADNYGPV